MISRQAILDWTKMLRERDTDMVVKRIGILFWVLLCTNYMARVKFGTNGCQLTE